MTNIIKLPQLAWYNPSELKLPVADGWRVEVCNMAGYNRPAMTDEEMRHSITHLIGSPPIREIARGKQEVVIIFDDIARVTRVARIVPFVLEELKEAGIPDRKIRFIAATGTHGAMTREDFAKKLGEPVLQRFRFYNHNPFDNCTYVGTTSHGTKVHLNSEFMQCDFRIAIGSITPHLFTVFGGGGKIILPGISSFETTSHNHSLPCEAATKAKYETHTVPLDMNEAADFAHLDVNIEGLINLWGETTAIFAGEFKQSHEAGILAAKSHYLTKKVKNKDVVIANTYAKVKEAGAGLGTAYPSVKLEGGDVVLICNSPQGQVVHYLGGPWGENFCGRQSIKIPVPPHVNHLIVYTEYPDLTGLGFIEQSEKVMMLNKWDDVLKVLHESNGGHADVAVYPNADIQQYSGE
jgi:nickel-dependent lactate racemase